MSSFSDRRRSLSSWRRWLIMMPGGLQGGDTGQDKAQQDEGIGIEHADDGPCHIQTHPQAKDDAKTGD